MRAVMGSWEDVVRAGLGMGSGICPKTRLIKITDFKPRWGKPEGKRKRMNSV